MRAALKACLCACGAMLALANDRVQSAPITWTIDVSASYLQLDIPEQNVILNGSPAFPIRSVNQDPITGNASGTTWTSGNKANYSGSIVTNYVDGSSIEFLAAKSTIVGVQAITAFPNAANFVQSGMLPPGQGSYTGTNGGPAAPAVYSTVIQTKAPSVATGAIVSLPSVGLDIASGVLPITGSDFAATSTSVGMVNGSAEMVLAGLVASIAGYTGQQFSFTFPLSVNTTGGNGTVTVINPVTRQLMIPITIPIIIGSDSAQITATGTGLLVATAIIPEPSSLVLAGFGAVAIAGVASGRRRARSGFRPAC